MTVAADKLDAFRVYRSTTVSEVLLYCYYVLRETMLAGLVQLAEQQLRDAQPDSEDSFEVGSSEHTRQDSADDYILSHL